MVIKVIKNILFSGLEQVVLIVSQFLSSILIIRTLPREQYGLIGVVAGYFVFFNLINISIESILLRDHLKYESKIKSTLENICSINILKLGIIFILSAILSFFLFSFFNSKSALYAVGISFFTLSSQAFVSPFIIYYGTKFKQKIITKISVARILIRLFCLLGLIYIPTLLYFFLIETFVSIMFCSIWFYSIRKTYRISIANIISFKKIDWKFVRTAIFEYSIWTHLTGVVTNFIYRADTFFLSFFVGLPIIGNYTIALNSSNFANIIPSIIGYQNSVALSNLKNNIDIEKTTEYFLRIAFYLGLISMVLFLVFGEPLLKIMTGENDVDIIYNYLICIVVSLIIIKTFSSPLVALINTKGSVKNFFLTVSVPLILTVTVSYFLSAYFFGAIGIAIANIFNALIWLFLVILEIKRHDFKIKFKIQPREDLQDLRKLLQQQ